MSEFAVASVFVSQYVLYEMKYNRMDFW